MFEKKKRGRPKKGADESPEVLTMRGIMARMLMSGDIKLKEDYSAVELIRDAHLPQTMGAILIAQGLLKLSITGDIDGLVKVIEQTEGKIPEKILTVGAKSADDLRRMSDDELRRMISDD